MNQFEKDPVCGMTVPPDSFAMDYMGMRFAFCSEQCRERFRANPNLYIGAPGVKAPKQEGKEVIKRRRFALEQALSERQSETLRQELRSMMGIRDVSVSGNEIEIAYDLLQATAEQIEAQIQAVGVTLGAEWGERLRRGFVHYLEEIETSSLEVSPPRSGHRHG